MRFLRFMQQSRKPLKSGRLSHQPRRTRPQVECLEDRVVPTVLFAPQNGAETAVYHGGPVVSNSWGMPIYTIFWGSYWATSAGQNFASQIENSLNSMFYFSSYLSSLSEYGVNYPAGVNGSGTVQVFDYSDPGNPFNGTDVYNEATWGINGLGLPTPYQYSNRGVYFVITAPGANFVNAGTGGYHTYGTSFINADSQFEQFNFGLIRTNGSIDSATYIISHEVIETLTDPHGDAWQVNPYNASAWNEVCDNEAQNYDAYLPGSFYLVQSHWSNNYGEYIVSDGNSQNFYVNNGTLYLDGDQLGANYNDTISVYSNGGGGVYVVMNGQVASFPNGEISNIQVYPGGGSNTINVYSTNVSVSIDDVGTDTVNVGLGYTQSINAYVYTYGTGATQLYVNDSSDGGGHTVNMYNGEITGLETGNIYWSPTSSSTGGTTYVNVIGSNGGSTYNVYDTSSFYYWTYLQTGGGSDTVNVNGTTGGLYVYNSGGQDYVYAGNGTMSSINGFVYVYGAGSTYLYVEDYNDGTNRTANLNSFSLSGLSNGLIEWSATSSSTGGVTYLDINGPAAGSTFNVNDTSNFYYYTYLSTGAGSDVVNVNGTTGFIYVYNGGGQDYVYAGNGTMSSINGSVYVYGAGSTYLYVLDYNDSGNHTVSMYDGEISGLAPANIYWSDASPSTGQGGVDFLDVLDGTGTNTFNVYGTSPFYWYTLLNNGSNGGFAYVNVQSTSANGGSGNRNLWVNGGSGGQSVTVGSAGTVGNINGDVYVYNSSSSGYSSLFVNDSGDSGAHTVSMYDGEISGLAPANIFWSDGSSSSGFGGVYLLEMLASTGANTVNVYSTSALYDYTWINGTGGAGTTVNVRSTAANGASGYQDLYVDNSGSGAQTVTIGSNAPGSGGNVGAINGGVEVYGSGPIALIVDDTGDGSGRSATLTASTLSGLGNAGTIIYGTNVSSLTINGGNHGNTLTVSSTSASTPVTWNAGGGTNTLVGPNTNNTWTISGTNSGSLSNLTFNSVQNLTGGTANDLFRFTGAGKVTGTVTGGGGTDTLDYSLYGSGVTVNLLTGTATGTGGVTGVHNVNGSPFNDTITGDNAGDVIALGGGKDIVKGGTGNDTFILSATQLLGSKVTGGGGTDTVVGPNANNTWTISSSNGGKVSNIIGLTTYTTTFTGIANLVGGTGVDVFKFSGVGKVTGTINGGGAPAGQGDWLDYSIVTYAVTVDLTAGTAVSTGGVSGIQNVHGGNHGNNLKGSAQGNILIGGTGSNTITGGSGMSILIADKGASTITGGSSSGDILIGDSTTYDSMTAAHETALMAILAEWQSADTYANRFSKINTGVGMPGSVKLKWATTVKDNPLPDAAYTLKAASASGVDWFFLDSNDTKVNYTAGDHVNNT
jgi:hypothetical protein